VISGTTEHAPDIYQRVPSAFAEIGWNQMQTYISVKLTIKELDLLTALASDQLFRKEFIEHRFPGSHFDPEELRAGKRLVERLRSLVHGAAPPRAEVGRVIKSPVSAET
jgi:hypothetical protein